MTGENTRRLDLPREPPDPPNDVDLLGRAVKGAAGITFEAAAHAKALDRNAPNGVEHDKNVSPGSFVENPFSAGASSAMPLPEKEYFSLEEVEERWGMQRRDTIYYAENGLLEVSTRVRGVVLDAGFVEIDGEGRWLTVLEDRSRFSGLVALHEHDLSEVFLCGAAWLHSFRAEPGRYLNVVRPDDGVIVRVNALVVTRAERDRFEREHGLTEGIEPGPTQQKQPVPAIECSEDGGWIRVRDREYLFTGCLQKLVVRRLYEEWQNGRVRLNMQSLLEDIESRSRHISQLFSGANSQWREIVGYEKGFIWLKVCR